MKFKLIKLTSLLTFVMAIMMLAPLHEGISGDPSAHMPDLWIDGDPYLDDGTKNDRYGKYDTPNNPGPHLINTAVDPRERSFNEMCGTNGDESVSGFAWYYKGGMFDDPAAHAADPNGPNHGTAHVQTIYELYLNGSASTSANEASGSLDPGISHAESIELPADHSTRSFKGLGKIKLDIYITNYHVPIHTTSGPGGSEYYYRGCKTHTSDFYYFKPGGWEVIKVLVNIKNVKEKRTGSISAGVESKGASSSFTHG